MGDKVTIANLFQVKGKENKNWELFGCAPDFKRRANAAFQKVGQAIMEEQEISQEETKKLSKDTVLGPKAMEAYQKFIYFIENEKTLSPDVHYKQEASESRAFNS